MASGSGSRRAPYRVLSSVTCEWLLAGTGLRPGSTFGSFGIEIDHKTAAPPPGIEVVAEIPGLFRLGSAQMTYYETGAGAKVFAAGAFLFASSVLFEPVSTMLENLWARLSSD